MSCLITARSGLLCGHIFRGTGCQDALIKCNLAADLGLFPNGEHRNAQLQEKAAMCKKEKLLNI